MRIDKIVVHCADTYASMDIGVLEIDQWHKQRGWKGVGYHYVIRRNGIIERGRDEGAQGAHVVGHNQNSLGICLVGGKPDRNFTGKQMIALRELVSDLLQRYPKAEVLGHRDLDPAKECPRFDVREELNHA